MEIFCPPALKELAKKINHPVYITGGFVRNQLCGYPFDGSDIDICGAFSFAEFEKFGIRAVPINKTLGTAKIVFNGSEFEYTRFRAEKYDAGGGHSPCGVEFIDELEKDALRRDFTCNAVYYCVKSGEIIDPLGGANDAQDRVLRAFNPEKVFESDGLRLMRLARFAAELGFKIEPKTMKAAQKFRANLKDIAAERKRDELDKILNADLKYGQKNAHYKGLKYLEKADLWQFILPSFKIMDIPQNPKYHIYSVLQHTFVAVKFAPPHVRLAALMHDTGKPVCQFRDGNMHRHAEESALIVLSELGQNGLKYPSKTVKEVAALVRLHMYDLKQVTSDSKMSLFVAKNFEVIDKLQNLAVADGKATGQKNLHKPRFAFFKRKLLKDRAPLSLRDLKINGTDALSLGINETKIGGLLQGLWEECILNPKLNNREWLLKRLNSLDEQTKE